MKPIKLINLLSGLLLLTVIACSHKEMFPERKSGEQIAADYVQTLGYTKLVHEGQNSKYTLEQKMLENLDYMQLWGVQNNEPDAYFGKEIVTYQFTVKDHPLEQQYSPENYSISVSVMLVDSKVIGGTSGPRSKIKNLVMAGGEYSIEGKTLKEIKNMEYAEWLSYWGEKYGKLTE